jgi:sugar phosphate isomerase/epimerase
MGLDRETLEAIARSGYLGVETVDVPGGDPSAARRVLADLELAVTSSHTWSALDDEDAFVRASASVAELGSGSVIVSASAADWLDPVGRLADRLNAAAAVAAGYGLRLGYHNHDAEIRPLEGRPALVRLAELVDPAVLFQVDIFWVTVGGADPAAVIEALGERVVSLHLKDGVSLPSSASTSEPFVNVPVGEGIVDPTAAVRAAEASGRTEWLVVEFDHVAGSAIDAVARSHDWLVDAGLARGRDV